MKVSLSTIRCFVNTRPLSRKHTKVVVVELGPIETFTPKTPREDGVYKTELVRTQQSAYSSKCSRMDNNLRKIDKKVYNHLNTTKVTIEAATK